MMFVLSLMLQVVAVVVLMAAFWAVVFKMMDMAEKDIG